MSHFRQKATRGWCLRVPRRSRGPIPSKTVNWIRVIRRGHDLGGRARILAWGGRALVHDWRNWLGDDLGPWRSPAH
jgi:hypothetical protein